MSQANNQEKQYVHTYLQLLSLPVFFFAPKSQEPLFTKADLTTLAKFSSTSDTSNLSEVFHKLTCLATSNGTVGSLAELSLETPTYLDKQTVQVQGELKSKPSPV